VYCELANLTLPFGSAAQVAGPAHPSTDMLPTITLPKAVSQLQ
jgi:hypothetical protein